MTPEAPAPTPAPAPVAEKPKLKDRLKAMLEEYGPVAFITWFGVFLLVLGLMAVGVKLFGVQVAEWFGVKMDGAVGTAGTLAIAYAITQGTKPLRILATLALTPVIAKVPFVARTVERFRKR